MRLDVNTKYKNVDEFTFWRMYIYLLNLQTDDLTKAEQVFMAHILTGTYNITQLSRGNRSKLINKLGISSSRFTHLKQKLEKKNYLIGEKYDLLPHSSLKQMQKLIKNKIKEEGKIDFEFFLPVKIHKDE